jgi:hypothetical protein
MGVYLLAVHYPAWGLLPAGTLAPRLGLLYAIMALTFLITRPVLQGPWWLGSLTAVLLMAHPLKTEALLAPGGTAELLDALGAVACLSVVAALAPHPAGRWGALGLATASAWLPWGPPGGVALVATVYLTLAAPGSRRRARALALLPTLAGLWAVTREHPVEIAAALPGSLVTASLPLHPLGYLPETAATLRGMAGLAWAWIAACAVAAALLCRATRHPALVWTAVALPLWCLLDHRAVDWVDFQGGGRMLVPILFAVLGFAALCRQAMRHPAWGRHVVGLTTLLCVAFFVLQVQALRQHGAARALAVERDSTTGALPVDWRRAGPGAVPPLRREDAVALFPMAHAPGVSVSLASWGEERGEVDVDGARPAALLWPYWQPAGFGDDPGGRFTWWIPQPDYDDATLHFRRARPAPGEAATLAGRVVPRGGDGLRLVVTGEGGRLPDPSAVVPRKFE